jgi:hypothetical protein
VHDKPGSLFAQGYPADILDQEIEMQWIGRRRQESEMLIEPPRRRVLGMNREGANAADIGGLQSAAHGILQQAAETILAKLRRLPASLE